MGLWLYGFMGLWVALEIRLPLSPSGFMGLRAWDSFRGSSSFAEPLKKQNKASSSSDRV